MVDCTFNTGNARHNNPRLMYSIHNNLYNKFLSPSLSLVIKWVTGGLLPALPGIAPLNFLPKDEEGS